jgi:hypothetical protein
MVIYQRKMSGACSTHQRDEKFIRILDENPEGRDHLADTGFDGRIMLKLIIRKCGWRMVIGLIQLRIAQ